MRKHAIIIGSGFGGLGMACLLSASGYQVTVLEQNECLGGRASVFKKDGFTFDMGPSWYLMPDVFEDFFALLGERVEDHLTLKRLGPSYRIYFKDTDIQTEIVGDPVKDMQTIAKLEPGSETNFKEYLRRATIHYTLAIRDFLYQNYNSILDFLNPRTVRDGLKLSVFRTMDSFAKKFFHTDKVRKIVQYPLVFLGTSPYQAPALYSMMSHLDFNQGVFYPMGGIGAVVQALANIATRHGATFKLNTKVKRIIVTNNLATGVELADGTVLNADLVISNASMHFTESQLLDAQHREHPEAYWNSRTLAPSALLAYIGLNQKIPNAAHHTLIFSEDWKTNFDQIFKKPEWPSDPSLYMCMPSVTDPSVAPQGKENIVVLIPIAPGLEDSAQTRRQEMDKAYATISKTLGIPDIKSMIQTETLFSVSDFATRYGATKGTALGMAHTLFQTAAFRPNNTNKHVHNLYYVGADTNPGIGMPVCLVSAELAYKRIIGNTSPHHLTSLTKVE